jgi:hypothetical protein
VNNSSTNSLFFFNKLFQLVTNFSGINLSVFKSIDFKFILCTTACFKAPKSALGFVISSASNIFFNL